MDFRQRLEQSRVRPANAEPPAEKDEHYACPYFATDRGKSPACLELRLPDGIRRAVPYAFFTEIIFDIDAGIEILTTQKRITITGRQLAKLYDYLVAYRVRFIQVHTGTDAEAEDGVFVYGILIEERY